MAFDSSIDMSVFQAKFDVTKTVNVKITASNYEIGPSPATTHTPENIINNDSFDPSKRWTVEGNNHFIDFDFDQQLVVHGVSIAWYAGNENRYTFKIKSSSAPGILFNGVSTGGIGSYETYKLKTPLTTNNIRILCNGNLEDEWTRISAIQFRLEPILENTVAPFPDCPEGQHWHEALGRCISDIITEPPNIVIIDPIQTVRQGDSVSLDASQSSDPIGSNLFFEWIQVGGELIPTGSKLQSNIVFRAPTVDSELKFRLKVTNAGNLSSTKDATVVVRASIPQCPPGEVWDEKTKRCISPQEEPAVKPKSKKHRPIIRNVK